jgi:uncharacterized protein YyaL (SSP411 family)
MKPYERELLLERIDREAATVGATIPEQIEVQGTEVALRELVFEIRRQETVPEHDRERVAQAKRNLRRERRERRQRIEDDAVSFERGETLVESIVGIERALEGLQALDQGDIEAEAQASQTAGERRWMSFLKQVLGEEDGTRLGGR